MTLHPTAREANVMDSLKRYWRESLGPHQIQVTFDKGIEPPKLQGHTADRWVAFVLGPLERYNMSDLLLNAFCCTRMDNEGYKLAQVGDIVCGYLVDIEQTDGMRRIPFYRSYPNQPWELLGSLLVQEFTESPREVAKDGTKFKIITIRLRWGAKL